MHTFLGLRGSIFTFVWLSEAKVHDVQSLDILPVEPGAYYLMDRGYVDFYRLFNYFQQRNAFFVTRIKNRLKYNVVEEHEVDKNVGLISDQSIKLTGLFTKTDYPDMVRLVIYEDFNTSTVYKFLTNDFTLPAITIAELYRERWNVEQFFKWIKQHLHIKAFFGTSQNAVYALIWIAICDYLLLIIAKRVYHI